MASIDEKQRVAVDAPPPRGWPIVLAIGGAIVLVVALVAWLVLREPSAAPTVAAPSREVPTTPSTQPAVPARSPVVTTLKRTRGVVRPTRITTTLPDDDSANRGQ